MQDSFSSIRDAMKITSLSRSSIYRGIRDGSFPRPRVLSWAKRKDGTKVPSRVAFLASEIAEWVVAHAEEVAPAPAPRPQREAEAALLE